MSTFTQYGFSVFQCSVSVLNKNVSCLASAGTQAGPEGRLGVPRNADGEVLDVGGPGDCQLEERHVPLDAIDEDWQDFLLVPGPAEWNML